MQLHFTESTPALTFLLAWCTCTLFKVHSHSPCYCLGAPALCADVRPSTGMCRSGDRADRAGSSSFSAFASRGGRCGWPRWSGRRVLQENQYLIFKQWNIIRIITTIVALFNPSKECSWIMFIFSMLQWCNCYQAENIIPHGTKRIITSW